jgi:D-serine deaminase-like pyridoxal phosphate-dependent protein
LRLKIFSLRTNLFFRMTEENKSWCEISNADEVDSPALLIYPERVEKNIRQMIAMVGTPERLCPHVKTHKMTELIRMQMDLGIRKFKCSTIAEVEMVADCGSPEILLAYQPVGPKLRRFLQLAKRFSKIQFSALVDDESALRAISKESQAAGTEVGIFVDLDIGMHRSGVSSPEKALELYRLIATLPGIKPAGLHAYDGHISDSDPNVRAEHCNAAFGLVDELRKKLLQEKLPVPRIVAGGSPTFAIHARRTDVECSPGTTVLWDEGYGRKCADLKFLPAAVVLTRVISKPGKNRLCLDLGHKAIAAENPHPRVLFVNLPDANAVMHSEEHLVVETEHADEFPVGTCLYGIPRHICPTVALYSEAVVVENGVATKRWKVVARNRALTV